MSQTRHLKIKHLQVLFREDRSSSLSETVFLRYAHVLFVHAITAIDEPAALLPSSSNAPTPLASAQTASVRHLGLAQSEQMTIEIAVKNHAVG